MTLADVHPGGWADHEILTHAQMNLIRAELLQAVDGAGGGTYTLSSPLVFAGSDVEFDSNVVHEGDVLIDATGVLTIDGNLDVNSIFSFDGQGNFNDDVNVNDRIVFRSAGTTEFRVGNTVTFYSLGDVLVNSESWAMRLPVTPIDVAKAAGVAYWEYSDDGWLNVNASSFARIWFAVPVMAGDVITEVRVSVRGGFSAGHGGIDPTNKIRVRLREMGPSDSSYVSISTRTDAASGAFYDGAHFIDLSPAGGLPYTALDRQYAIEVRGENGGTAASNENLIAGIFVTLTRNQLVPTNVLGG
jgi:hypothetical protein